MRVRRLIGLAAPAALLIIALLLTARDATTPSAPPQLGELPEALVVAIHDGDTVSVVRSGDSAREEVRIRLASIDAPEKGQAFGGHAKRALSQLAYRQYVRLWEFGQDKYGRTLARLYRSDDGLDINLELVRRGFAWHYLRYSNESALSAAEQTARSRRLGLWNDESPVPPWQYRGPRRGAAATADP